MKDTMTDTDLKNYEIQVKREINAKYMTIYMKQKYDENPQKSREYRNSMNTKRKYQISKEEWSKWKEHLHNVVKMKEIIDTLPSDIYQLFLKEQATMNFVKK